VQIIKRLEYKYFVPYERLDALRRRFLAGMQHDDFSRRMTASRYTVRSIYYDTPNFRFYHEKLQSVKNRKKLRIRTYNQPAADSPAFFEIKHKFGNVIYKERMKVPLDDAPALLEDGEALKITELPAADRTILNKFFLLFDKLILEPKVLVTYEREALQGLDDQRLRVTFDLNTRSYAYPEWQDLFREDDLNAINDNCFILEIKFDEWMPFWVQRIVSDYDLHRQSISKYCKGLEEWLSLKHGRRGWKI